MCMTREEFLDKLSEAFQDEPDNDKYNYVLECADAYAETYAKEYMEQKKERERLQFGKDICENAEVDVNGIPDEVFKRITDRFEDRMMSNSSKMEQEVISEVLREYWTDNQGN